jgi:hypothetical protein
VKLSIAGDSSYDSGCEKCLTEVELELLEEATSHFTTEASMFLATEY